MTERAPRRARTSVAHRKPRGQGAERHSEILTAATRIFAEEGFDQATIRRIAAEAGTTASTIYIYFPGKEAMLHAIRDQTLLNLYQTVNAAVGQGAARERFVRHLRAYVEFGLAHPDEYRLTFSSRIIRPPRRGRPTVPAEGRDPDCFTQMVATLRELTQTMQDDDGEPHLAAETVWAMAHGLVMLMIDVPNFPPDNTFDELFDKAIAVLLDGLAGA